MAGMTEPAADLAEIPAPAPEPAAPFDPMLALIERAARDPAVDLAKLQGLMKMKKDVEADRASIAFAEAFTELGPELPVIDRRGRIVVFSKTDREKPGGVPEGAEPIQKTPYATLDDILEAIRAPLHKHGFSLRFEHEATTDNRLVTTAIVRHRMGHEARATTPPLQHDSTGSKNPTQAIGSSLTYGKRYALMAVLPIVSHAPEDADDDGEASGRALIDVDQVAFIEQQIRDTGSDVEKFLKTIGAASVSAITQGQYRRAIGLLNMKKRKMAAS